MSLPKTYEEFLKTPKLVLAELSVSPMTADEARLFISFINRLDKEPINNRIVEVDQWSNSE